MAPVELGCPLTAVVCGPRGERGVAPCTGPRGHESPCTFSFVPGQTGVYTVVPDCGAWWSKTAIGGSERAGVIG